MISFLGFKATCKRIKIIENVNISLFFNCPLKTEIFTILDYDVGIILSVKYRKEKCLEIPKEIDELHKRIMTCAKRINVCHI